MLNECLLATRWNRLRWNKTNTWKHLQPLLVVAGENFPNIVVMFPKKVEQEKVAHQVKKWPKRPRHANKTSHWIQLRFLFLYMWKFWVNLVLKKIRWRGLGEVFFEWKVMKFWTSTTNLSWVHTVIRRTFYFRVLSKVAKVY